MFCYLLELMCLDIIFRSLNTVFACDAITSSVGGPGLFTSCERPLCNSSELQITHIMRATQSRQIPRTERPEPFRHSRWLFGRAARWHILVVKQLRAHGPMSGETRFIPCEHINISKLSYILNGYNRDEFNFYVPIYPFLVFFVLWRYKDKGSQVAPDVWNLEFLRPIKKPTAIQ